MKVRASVKKICVKCKVITRRGVVRVIYQRRKAQAAPGTGMQWRTKEDFRDGAQVSEVSK